MARETGDLWPQSSGSASLGAEMSNGGFTGAVRPFASVHQNSGIFYNPSRGSSGVVRFQNSLYSVSSLDGDFFGLSFDGGQSFPLEVGSWPGAGSYIVAPTGSIGVLTGDSFNVLAGLNIGLQTPGNVTVVADNGDISLTAPGGNVAITASDPFGQVSIYAGFDILLECIDDISIRTAPFGRNVLVTSASQFDVSAFNLSGLFQYRFGPHQSWAIKTSHASTGGPSNDGFWPIAHSGNVNQMINTAVAALPTNITALRDETAAATSNSIITFTDSGGGIDIATIDAGTIDFYSELRGVNGVSINNVGEGLNVVNGVALSGLQAQYELGRRVYIASSPGNLEFIANTAKTKFAGTTTAAINLSGVFTRPNASQELGDMYVYGNSCPDALGAFTNATSPEESAAKALGVGSLCYDTGSGIVAVSVSSGIAQFLNNGNTLVITTVAQTVPLNISYQSSDKNFGLGTGLASGQITIFSPGLYRATYKCYIRKTVGTTPQTCDVSARLNGGNILGSTVGTFHFDATTAASNSTIGIVLFNANAGDVFDIQASSSLAGADNCSLGTRGALCQIEKVGSRRGTF